MANAFLEQKLMPIDYSLAGQMHMRGIDQSQQQKLMQQAAAAQANAQREAWAREDQLAAEERDRQARRMSSPMPEAPVSDYNPEAAIYNTAWIANKYGVNPLELSRGASAAGMGGGGGGRAPEAQPVDPNMMPTQRSADVQRQMAERAGTVQHERAMEIQQQKGDIESQQTITETALQGGMVSEERTWKDKGLDRYYDFKEKELDVNERIASGEITSKQGLDEMRYERKQAEDIQKQVQGIHNRMDYSDPESIENKARIQHQAELTGTDEMTLWMAWMDRVARADQMGK